MSFEQKTATLTAKKGKAITRAMIENAFKETKYGVNTFSEVPRAKPGG